MQTKAFNVVNMLCLKMPFLLLCHFQIFHFVFTLLGMNKKKKAGRGEINQSPPTIPNEVASHLCCYPDAEGREHLLGGDKQDWTYSKKQNKKMENIDKHLYI